MEGRPLSRPHQVSAAVPVARPLVASEPVALAARMRLAAASVPALVQGALAAA